MTSDHTAAPSATDSAAVDALSRLLFGPEGTRVHRPWADLISSPEFQPHNGLSSAEQTELAYKRLRRVNAAIDSPLSFVRDPVRLAALHEWAAIADGSTAALVSIHYNLYLGSLAEARHESGRALDDVLAMRATGAFLVTEVGHGADAAALETTATHDPATGAFVLHTPSNAAQKFMPNTSMVGGPKYAVVAARLLSGGTDHGVFLFHVQLSGPAGPLPGVRIRELPAGTGLIDHCLTAFDSVRLPAHALLEGEHGSITGNGEFSSNLSSKRRRFLHAIGRVTSGKICMSAAACSMSRAAVAIAVRYAHHRRISGAGGTTVPLAAHRSHHAPLIGDLARTYAMTLLHRTTLSNWANADEDRRQALERDIALLKAHTTWSAQDIILEARERCGAHGLLPDNGFSRWTKVLQGAITAEGDNRAIMAKAAGEMLLEERPPAPAAVAVTTLDRGVTTIRDLRCLLTAVEDLAAARARSRLSINPDLDRLDRWNTSCLPALDAAAAHTSGAAADAFIAAVDECTDPGARHLLEELCWLYLLQELRQYTDVLLAEGHVTAAFISQLPDSLESTTSVLQSHMLTLTDAFGLDGLLASVPLAHPTFEQRYDDPDAHWHTGEGELDTLGSEAA
ncbi:acyl-CoA dehydrogenase [Streptomyces lydicus]|uniref:acyl-CoA dehydrogenase family protein n=1 Tax=Streptomyces lydicus TaxID=47763 RepID=UPI001010188A|nr:acyl-CoA dehydrogenase [Streptomyces lydicus]MCZ1012078.1 acyl-CoA dehydrogenase family protein [Streptomyces lydicus]